MSKLIAISGTNELVLPEQSRNKKRNAQGLTSGDYRRLLSQLRMRPPTQRAFLRKLLTRALATSPRIDLPVTSPVVDDPVGPS